jgi:hypothetical protein
MTIAEYLAKYPDAPITDKPFERSLTPQERSRRRAQYKLRWQQNNPANYKSSMDRWVKANPDKVNARTKAWYAKYPEKARSKARRINLRRNYGITMEQYEMMYAAQEGLCAICGREETSARFTYLAIDHCHHTGDIRGLLCSRCNIVIGQMEENPDLLRKAAAYIERFQDVAPIDEA